MNVTQELIMLLTMAMEGNTITIHEVDGEYFLDNQNNLVQEIENRACIVLIDDEGQCNWSNIRAVEKAGFDVFAGEKDSFGWLTGCIRIPGKGIVVYG